MEMMPELIIQVVDKGGEVTLRKSTAGKGVMFDMHTDAKSHLYLYPVNGGFELITRYSQVEFVKTEDFDYESLLYKIKSCLCGREYVSSFWMNEMIKNNILKPIPQQRYEDKILE